MTATTDAPRDPAQFREPPFARSVPPLIGTLWQPGGAFRERPTAADT